MYNLNTLLWKAFITGVSFHVSMEDTAHSTGRTVVAKVESLYLSWEDMYLFIFYATIVWGGWICLYECVSPCVNISARVSAVHVWRSEDIFRWQPLPPSLFWVRIPSCSPLWHQVNWSMGFCFLSPSCSRDAEIIGVHACVWLGMSYRDSSSGPNTYVEKILFYPPSHLPIPGELFFNPYYKVKLFVCNGI